jgi:hypothetical protein
LFVVALMDKAGILPITYYYIPSSYYLLLIGWYNTSAVTISLTSLRAELVRVELVLVFVHATMYTVGGQREGLCCCSTPIPTLVLVSLLVALFLK